MNPQSPLSKDDPILIAWKAYKATPEYDNSFEWGRSDEHRDGSMRAAFLAGCQFIRASARPGLLDRDQRQQQVIDWAIRAFTAEQALSLPQRGVRLVEEAVEAAQTAGTPADMLHSLVDYVYARPVGELSQGLGGVQVVALSMAAAAGFSADDAERTEIKRIFAKPIGQFTARNQAKNDAGFDTGRLILEPKA